jgi:hypothetical protein
LDEIKLLKYINKNDPGDTRRCLRLYDFFYYKEHLFIVCELLRCAGPLPSVWTHREGGAGHIERVELDTQRGWSWTHREGGAGHTERVELDT